LTESIDGKENVIFEFLLNSFLQIITQPEQNYQDYKALHKKIVLIEKPLIVVEEFYDQSAIDPADENLPSPTQRYSYAVAFPDDIKILAPGDDGLSHWKLRAEDNAGGECFFFSCSFQYLFTRTHRNIYPPSSFYRQWHSQQTVNTSCAGLRLNSQGLHIREIHYPSQVPFGKA